MPQETTILGYLTAHADAHLDVAIVDTRRIRMWLADLDNSSREGIRRAWLVGRALNAERDRLEHGQVEAWEKARAKALGRKVRTLQNYRYLAESLEDPKIALSMRISIADQGLDALLRTIRRIRKEQTGQSSTAATDQVVAWKRRATRLLAAVPKGRVGIQLLEAHLADVRDKLAEARGH